jgi:hypothetical protein
VQYPTAKLRDRDDIKVIKDQAPGLSCGNCHSHNIILVEFIYIESEFGDITSEPFYICESCFSKNIGRICPECGVFSRLKDTIRDEVYCEPCGMVLIRNKQLQY